MFFPISVTLCDAQIQPNKCNSYANVFPIDDIQTCKNEQTYQSSDIWLGILKIGTGSGN